MIRWATERIGFYGQLMIINRQANCNVSALNVNFKSLQLLYFFK